MTKISFLLTLIITFIGTAGGVVYMIKSLITTNKKDVIKMLIFFIVIIVANIINWYFFL